VKIERVRIEQFGALRDFDTGSDPLPSLVVIYGPNESGKSTFFTFLGSMLYGFYPASRDAHPYKPWTGTHLEGEATGVLDTGVPWEVRRRLRSSPWGRLKRGTADVELRNATLPFVDHVPRDVFSKVFSLRLSELVELDGNTWSVIEDRLMASLVRDDVRLGREVGGELRTEAQRLWRPDNRGRPRARELTNQIRDLQEQRRIAEARDDAVRTAQASLVESRVERAELDQRREELSELRRSLERLVPAQRRLTEFDAAHEDAADADSLEDLPSEPLHQIERWSEEEGRIRTRLEGLEARALRLQEASANPDRATSALLRDADEIRARSADFDELAILRARLEGSEQDLAALEARIDRAQAAALLPTAPGAGPAWRDQFVALDPERVRACVQEARSARERLRAQVAEVPRTPTPSPPLQPESTALSTWTPVGALVAGIVFLGVGSGLGHMAASAAGGALLLFGMLGLGVAWDRSRRPQALTVAEPRAAQVAEHAQSVTALRREAEAAAEGLASLLAGLPVRPEILEAEDALGLAALLELPGLLGERRRRQHEGRDRRARLDGLEADARGWLMRVDGQVPETPDELAKAARSLGGRVHQAQGSESARDQARRDRELVRNELGEWTERAQELATLRTVLSDRLGRLGDGDEREGDRRVRRMRTAARRLGDLGEALRRDFGAPATLRADLETFAAAHPAQPLSQETLDRTRGALEGLARRAEELSGRIRGLETDIRHLEEQPSMARIYSEIETLSQERDGVRRERDRLELLANIVELAEQRFRDRHQPDVVRRGGEYLSRITDGRYVRLVHAQDEHSESLLLLERGDGRLVGLSEALSTGTREQVLLSLRLAAADHLDQRGERLPLCVDEVFVNWDRGRRDRGLELMTEVAKDRQVFVFTCHPEVAERLATLGARVLSMPT